ncbi:hypothetical protein OS493_028086 [Desmophyllum pertusum]|uniref:Uncharacterized protein n=1 Tax=Desmophyllum pertusum TaxID=174260 RepID=A0A9W9ZLB3_9CNID|nr:hypothetical protein OS493_028086 [Desmophyllum pertusum]
MSTTISSDAGLFFCPISSLPDLVEKEKLPCLADGLVFDLEVKPGWIHYNPNKVTVLSCNEMFEPIYPVPRICQTQQHIIKIATNADYESMQTMFVKPIIMCVTRRQEDEAMINGFDMDFIVVFSPSDPKVAKELSRITEHVEKQLRKRNKFFLTMDLSERLDEISPLDFKNHIMWLNCAFHVTNFHAPNPVLTLDIFYLWCVLLPCCIAIALPYRLYRKLRCVDKNMDLNIHFCLEASGSVPLALHFFSERQPLPGRYRTQSHKYHLRACPGTELRSLLYLMNC